MGLERRANADEALNAASARLQELQTRLEAPESYAGAKRCAPLSELTCVLARVRVRCSSRNVLIVVESHVSCFVRLLQLLTSDAERVSGAAEKSTGGALEVLENWCALADLSLYAERRTQLLDSLRALVDRSRALELSLDGIHSHHSEWHSLLSLLRAQLGAFLIWMSSLRVVLNCGGLKAVMPYDYEYETTESDLIDNR